MTLSNSNLQNGRWKYLPCQLINNATERFMLILLHMLIFYIDNDCWPKCRAKTRALNCVLPGGFLLESVVSELISKEICQAEHEYAYTPLINALVLRLPKFYIESQYSVFSRTNTQIFVMHEQSNYNCCFHTVRLFWHFVKQQFTATKL